MKYLKPKQEYIDRYDRMTVEHCRWAEGAIDGPKVLKHHEEKIDKSEEKHLTKAFNELHLFFVQGGMYEQKEETISKWMSEDEAHDRFYETAEAPDGITCLTCSREVFVESKHLDTNLDKPDRVLFMYKCTLGHTPMRSFYDSGEEWKYNKPKCPKCQSVFEQVDEDTDDVFKMTSTCPDCDYVEVSEIPRTANKKEKHDPEYEKDRARFCSEEEGRKYAEAMNNMKELGKLIKEVEEREENKDVYDEVEKIKKLTVIELEELLAPVFEKQGYTKLQFGTPDMSKDLFLPFTTYDTKSERRDRESSYELQKIAREALEGTNWRLMSDGISYRSGILTGRFRAYEREEDLLKLVKQIKVK